MNYEESLDVVSIILDYLIIIRITIFQYSEGCKVFINTKITLWTHFLSKQKTLLDDAFTIYVFDRKTLFA